MERRRFTREFKLEAVRLIKERGVSHAQASHDLSVHQSQLRSWVKALADDPQHAFPGQGQMKPEQGLALSRNLLRLSPPAFGVGGFSDKFNSLHTYGLAVDMLGIGGPGSSEAKLWHEIAARHGIVCPYGADNRREWNHCQPTRVKIILADNPLRGTVS